MRKKGLLLAILFFFSFTIQAQEPGRRPIIRYSPFYTSNISIEESRFIESLILSYLSDEGEVINFFDNMLLPSFSDGQDFQGSFDSWTKTPDYVLSGSIYLERDTRIFTLEIHNTSTAETTRSTSTHKTASDLVLKARSLVQGVFSSPVQAARASPSLELNGEARELPETITENNITGTWRGEAGIEMIYLQQGGRGVAFFSSGARMNLSYTIEKNILKVIQDSPNLERFYYPLPYGVARQLSENADPIRWELLLYAGGTHLKGIRISTEAKVENNMIVELLPETSRDSSWIRSNR